MLTAADRLDDKASGFELGADDYLTKPFELRELALRLRALDRRRAHSRPPVREIAGLRLDPFRREVYRDGRYVALTRKQFAVLEVLVAADGGVVSAEDAPRTGLGRERRPVHQRRAHHGLGPAQAARRAVAHRDRARRRLPHQHRTDTPEAKERSMDREPGLSVRLKLTLSYAAFLMLAGTLLLAVVWVFLLRYVPDGTIRSLGPSIPSQLRPRARVRSAGGRSAGVSAGVRTPRRLVPRRPNARRLWLGSRTPPAWRRPDRSRTGSGSRAAMTSSASSPTLSTRCSARLEAHDAEQQRFAANASHELRTPLAITQTLLDVARKDPSPRQRRARRTPPPRQRPGDRPHRSVARAQPRRPTHPLPGSPSTCRLSRKRPPRRCFRSPKQRGITIETSGEHERHRRLARAPAAADHEPRAQRDRPQPAGPTARVWVTTSARSEQRGADRREHRRAARRPS